jgi:hypothetical protein
VTRVFLFALCLIACSTNAPVQDTSQPRPRGIFQGESSPNTPSSPTTPAAAAPLPPPEFAAPTTGTTTGTQTGEGKAKPPTEEEDKPAERDLSAELLSAIGSPLDCLKTRSGDSAPSSINVQFDVTVLDTGLVTRAYAHSSQLDPEELQCMTKRASALQLRAPIDQAPRNISTTLQLTVKSPENPAN